MRHAQAATTGPTKRRRWRRPPLALPYATPPVHGSLSFDPALHTAAELMRDKASAA